MQRPTNFNSNEFTRSKFKLRDFIHLITQSKPHYWQLIVGLILGLFSTGMQLAVPKFAESLINGLGKHLNSGMVIAVIVLFIVSALISAASGTILGFFGEDVVYKLRDLLWNKLLRLPVSYFDTTKSGEISSHLVTDSTQVKDFIATSMPRMVTSILQLVGALVLMIAMDWKMTIMMFVAVPLLVFCILPVTRQAMKIARNRQDALAGFNGEAGEVLSEMRLVKSSNAEINEQITGHKRIHKLYRIGLKEAIYDSISGPLVTMVMMGVVVGMLAYGASRVAQGTLTMGTLFSFLMYLVQMIGPFGTLGQFSSDMAKASGSTVRIQELLNQPEESHETQLTTDTHGQTLAMNHVNFGYDEKQVLTDVSFTAQPNTVIAFAGPSGGGKSTIFNLLERFYQPNSGTITIGTTDLAALNLTNWRQQIGLVSQDAAIMAGTIRYNLTYGAQESYNDDQLWDVLEMAYAKDFVSKMPNGLDTEVGERGVKISGGQRQRLAIARAFLRDPQILMLDEATASLDSESEMMVQKALEKLMKNRTTLVIAHRLSTIVDANEIYFIENGQVSGHGTHQELVANHDLYREYVENQFGSSNPLSA